MKICFFVADITWRGGIERVLSNITSALVFREDVSEVTIVSQYRSNPQTSYFFNSSVKIVYLTNVEYSPKPGTLSRARQHLHNIGNVREFFKKNKFDIISSQTFTNTLLLWLAGVDLSNVMAVEHVYFGYYGKFLRTVRRFLYKRLMAVGVISRFDYEYYSKFLKSVEYVPNPMNVKDKYISELKEHKIIAIGRLETQKNFTKLIDIFSRVKPLAPSWTLHIYGNGTLRKPLQRQIEAMGLEGSIILEGATDNIEEKMRGSAFLVMTSLYEGFGMVLIEAMKNGVPCVSYDCPAGPADIIDNEVNGLLVPNQNEKVMENAILRMIGDYDLRKRLGNAAMQSVDRFDSDLIADIWMNVFKRYKSKGKNID